MSKAILSPPPLSTQPGSAAAQQKRDHIQAPLGAHAKVDARSHNAPFPFRMLLFAQRACVFFVRPPCVESCVPNHGIRPFGQLRTAKARTPPDQDATARREETRHKTTTICNARISCLALVPVGPPNPSPTLPPPWTLRAAPHRKGQDAIDQDDTSLRKETCHYKTTINLGKFVWGKGWFLEANQTGMKKAESGLVLHANLVMTDA